MKRLILCCAAVVALAVFSAVGYLRSIDGADKEADSIGSAPERGEMTNEGLPAMIRSGAWYGENGQIDQDGVSNALSQLNHYLAANQPTDGFGDLAIARGIRWVPRGPQNVGGRTRTLVVNFNNPDILWAGAASGGVWKSFDRGRNWKPLNNQLSNFSIASMAIDPENSQIIYAGTGDGPFTVSLRGHGIYRSINGGIDWVNLSATTNWAQVNSIAVARNGGNTIVLAAVGESSIGNGDGGIWRSTDGGDTWNPDIATSNASFVGFDPNNSSKAVVATCDTGAAKCKAYWTSNAGASTPTWTASYLGNTATPLPTPFRSPYETDSSHNIIEFGFSSSGGGSTTIYAQHSGHPTGSPSVISKSTDGGQNFTTNGLGGTPQNVSDYKSVLLVLPTPDANIVIGGGTSLFRSTNGGATFSPTPIAYGGPLETTPHDDMMFATNDPSSNKRVYVTTDGGIFRTEDISTASASPSPAGGWSQLNQTYQTTQFYAVGGDSNSGIISGGSQDNGSLRLNSNSGDAELMWGSDGGEAAVDGTVCFGQQLGGGAGILYRISDCGSSPVPERTSITNGIHDYADGVGLGQLVIDKNSSGHEGAFFGARSVWRTAGGVKSGTPSWYSIKANPAVTPSGGSVGYRPQVTAMDSAPTNSNYLWVGEWNPEGGVKAQLWRGTTVLGIPTWVRKDNGVDALPNKQITDIFVDPSGSNPDDIVYVSYGGFEDDNLWRTSDHGDHWANVTGGSSSCNPALPLVGLPCVPIRSVTVKPGDPATIYVGTEIGIYLTHDTGTHWSPVLDGPSNVSITELTFMDSGELLVGTYGRGIWTAPTPNVTQTVAPNDFDGDGRSDLAVVRPTASPAELMWHVDMTSDGYTSNSFGVPGDELTPADYDGDHKADIAVFHAASEQWYILKSTDSTTQAVELGEAGDIPVPADYDGDGLVDQAVFRPSNATWYINKSTAGLASAQWGGNDDTPIAADFDGDGIADLGAFQLKNGGYWELFFLTTHGSDEIQFGLEGDIPVVGDYDADGKADIAVWRPDDDDGNGCWYILYAADDYENYDAIPWGVSTDMPVPGDYDGDGKMDVAVWRPDDGIWRILESSNGYFSKLFGADGDIPVGRKVASGGNSHTGGGHHTVAPPFARPQRKTEGNIQPAPVKNQASAQSQD
jgi:hypothetical protein